MNAVNSGRSNRHAAVSPKTDSAVSFALRFLLNVAGLLGAYLLVSGVVLALGGYQATNPSGAWTLSHRWAAYGFTIVTILSVPFGLSLSMFRLKMAPVAITTGAILFAVVLGFTGSGLAFGQVALWEVVPGAEDQSFLAWLFQSGVRFFIVDGVEVSPTRMRVFSLMHLVVLPLIVATMGGVLSRYLRPPRRRRASRQVSRQAAEPESVTTSEPNEPNWI